MDPTTTRNVKGIGAMLRDQQAWLFLLLPIAVSMQLSHVTGSWLDMLEAGLEEHSGEILGQALTSITRGGCNSGRNHGYLKILFDSGHGMNEDQQC